jgi:hypothetical protein
VWTCRVKPPLEDVAGYEPRARERSVTSALVVRPDVDQHRPRPRDGFGLDRRQTVDPSASLIKKLVDRRVGLPHDATVSGLATSVMSGVRPIIGAIRSEGFAKATIDRETGTLTWARRADLAPDTLYERVRTGAWPGQDIRRLSARPESARLRRFGVHSVSKPTAIGRISWNADAGQQIANPLKCREFGRFELPGHLLAMQKVEGSNPFSRFAGSGSREPQVASWPPR